MATKAAAKRLAKESQLMQKDPPPFCFARPLENDVLTWHFILRGPPDTPYAGGEYWGQLLFPSDYPFKPPGIKMATPNGRFKENEKICTSMSDFHPGSWNPAWSVANILIGLHSFMNSDEMTTGSMSATTQARQTLAARSHEWNVAQNRFAKVFPEYAQDKNTATDLPNMGQQPGTSSKAATASAKATAYSTQSGTKAPAAQGDVRAPAIASSSRLATSPPQRTQPPEQDAASQPPQQQQSAAAATGTTTTTTTTTTGSNPSAPYTPPPSQVQSDSPRTQQPASKASSNYSSPSQAQQQQQRPPPPTLLSTRSKVALCFAVLAWLFVGRIISRTGASVGGAGAGT